MQNSSVLHDTDITGIIPMVL